jgi:hypothetical protein
MQFEAEVRKSLSSKSSELGTLEVSHEAPDPTLAVQSSRSCKLLHSINPMTTRLESSRRLGIRGCSLHGAGSN